jgi:alpha-ketoglutarate-dependent taurine dioxygenase
MTSAALHDGFVRLADAGRTFDFHLRWLRHNCDLDRHPSTGEKVSDSAELPEIVSVAEMTLDDHVLRIRWALDQRVSRFPVGWLREHAYAIDRASVPPPPALVATLELDGYPGPAATAERVLARVAEHGAALVRRQTASPEAETEQWIAAFEARGLRTIATHFGRIEDLRTDNTTNANTDQLGYTDAGIELHTDQPFLAHPPRYQVLQSIRAADRGGESLLADGKAAFEYLNAIDREAAQRLLTTPVRFHRKQKAFEREVISPIITLDGGFRIRSSYFTAAPYQLPFEQMEGWYRAHDRFVRIARQHRYEFALKPGDTLIYDNHRMLHGRTAFSGPRWVRGVYFDPTVSNVDDQFDASG